MIRNRLSLSCHLTDDGISVEVVAHSLKAEAPGQAEPVGRFTVDLAGWLALRRVLHLLMPPGGLSFTGDSMVDQAARRLRTEESEVGR